MERPPLLLIQADAWLWSRRGWRGVPAARTPGAPPGSVARHYASRPFAPIAPFVGDGLFLPQDPAQGPACILSSLLLRARAAAAPAWPPLPRRLETRTGAEEGGLSGSRPQEHRARPEGSPGSPPSCRGARGSSPRCHSRAGSGAASGGREAVWGASDVPAKGHLSRSQAQSGRWRALCPPPTEATHSRATRAPSRAPRLPCCFSGESVHPEGAVRGGDRSTRGRDGGPQDRGSLLSAPDEATQSKRW